MDIKVSMGRLLAVLDKPKLFVSGYAKSGTTWVQLMLDAHPAIACKGEGHLPNVLAQELEGASQRYAQYINGKNQSIFKEIEGFPLVQGDDVRMIVRLAACQMMAHYGADETIKLVGEKTPDTIAFLPQMRDIFPEGKFLFIHRDGRDVLTSLLKHNLRTGGAATTGGRTVEDFANLLGQDWAARTMAAKDLSVQHPEVAHSIRYEDLLKDPAPILKDVLDWLGLEATAQTVAQCIEASSFEALSKGRKIGEEDDASHFRKGGAGNWKQELTPEAVKAFEGSASVALRQFSYLE